MLQILLYVERFLIDGLEINFLKLMFWMLPKLDSYAVIWKLECRCAQQ